MQEEGLDRSDVENLYQRYSRLVLQRCRGLLKDEDLAADAMQDTFVKVLCHSATLNLRYPSGLLYRIATNTCLNALRESRRKFAICATPFLDTLVGTETTEERVVQGWELERVFLGVCESTRLAATLR